MPRGSLGVKFFVLLVAVVAVGLSSTLVLRELMIGDFRDYLEGEREDRAYWVIASLESSYESEGGWEREKVIDSTVWAYMLGIDMRLYDAGGGLVMDMGEAMESISPLVKKRIEAASERWEMDEGGRRVPYALFLRGEQIGRLEARFLAPRKEALFIKRSNRFLAYSVIALGGIALALSVVYSRKLTRPIKELTAAASRISEGDLRSRVSTGRSDELGRLSWAFNRMAEVLSRQEALRKRLTANVAHELRTPLSGVRGELEGMIDGLIAADRENLQSLYTEIGRLRSILDGIEDLSQVEASAMTLRKEELALLPFLRAIVDRYQTVFREEKVSLELECPEGLKAKADPDRLSQVVVNLLMNALKATEPGGRVLLSAAKGAGGGVSLEVSDTGSGISAEEIPLVFERFYRGARGGLGIGLAIVKELVEAHGGSVSVRSEAGRGSTFSVRLPA
jgi:two-component system sensor histidine kinase BaeS